MTIVYSVMKHYDNGEHDDYACNYDSIMVICASKEKAKQFIANIALDKNWEEGAPTGFTIKDFGYGVERVTHKTTEWATEVAYYTIESFRVLE